MPQTTESETSRRQRRARVLNTWSQLALTVLLTAPAAAHEFWIESVDFAPVTGHSVGIRLFVGDGCDNGRPYARNPQHLKAFSSEAVGRRPIAGLPGSEPAGQLVSEAPGLVLVGYESRATTITLEADRFEMSTSNVSNALGVPVSASPPLDSCLPSGSRRKEPNRYLTPLPPTSTCPDPVEALLWVSPTS
jgi:hypothetical protein